MKDSMHGSRAARGAARVPSGGPIGVAVDALLSAGFVPLRLSSAGRARWPRTLRPADSLRVNLLRAGPGVERRLAALWRRWQSAGSGGTEELVEGVWAIPLAGAGGVWHLAVGISERFLRSEQFDGCCAAMPADRRAMEGILRRLGLVREEELPRQEILLRGLWQSASGRLLGMAALAEVPADPTTPPRGPIEALVNGIDRRDPTNRGHSRRVAVLSGMLAEAAGDSPRAVRRAELAGLVHDVGKVALPSRILRKAGPLDAREYALVRRHPQIGCRMLKGWLGLRSVLGAVRHHHERWDGLGYPTGLRGEAIPRLARIVAIADAFDAMSSDRPYRPALARGEALEQLRLGSGTHFDPTLVACFLALDLSRYDRVRAVEMRLALRAAA